MANTKREDYVAQSFLYFFASTIASVVTPIIGIGYLLLNQGYIDVQKTTLKLVGIEAILVIITLIFWRSYIADKKLLTSSKNKYINTKPPKIDTRGINIPDIDID